MSIVLVLYGRADLGLLAVAALIDNTAPCFELIIVDNASPDEAIEAVSKQVRGATIIRNNLNVGFSAAVSVGALHASGEFLLILNSDVFVEHGWLPPLLAALDADSNLAGVSPLLLNLDGTVQEAGSVLFASADTTPVVDAERWALEFQRTVPYVSAACLLMRRLVYTQLGGMDTVYGRGYFEDVDLALELEDLGLSFAHVPGSVARHVRGGSSSLESATRQTILNREVFVDRWAQRLSLLPHAGTVSVGSRRRGRDGLAADRILVIDERLPHVDRGSGDPRMWQLATTMATTWPSVRVTFLAASLQHSDRYVTTLLSSGVEVAPCSLADAHVWLEQRAGHFSAVFISRPDNAAHFRSMLHRTQPQAMVVVDVEALYSRRTERQAALLAASDPSAAQVLLSISEAQRAFERESWQWATHVTCVCEEEAVEVRQAAPHTPVSIVQLVADVSAPVVPRSARRGALFFGGFMAGEASPNADAVGYLIEELMPLLSATHPALRLTVAGWNPPASVIRRDGGRVSVVGSVDDPAAVLGAHVVHLVPERFGAGIKTKLIESMACGTPFVTSTVAAQGLHLGELAQHLVADDAEHFVALAAALIDDTELWQRVHEGLLRVARDHFSTLAFTSALVDLMAELGVAPPMPT